jgi:transposase
VVLRTSIEEAADRAGRSTRTVNRLLARYRVNPTLLAFLPRKRGQAVGSRRLDPPREAIVEEAVDKWMASREPLPRLSGGGRGHSTGEGGGIEVSGP